MNYLAIVLFGTLMLYGGIELGLAIAAAIRKDKMRFVPFRTNGKD